jgi:protein-tyrosine phosphatase
MQGFADVHCHLCAGLDDGPRTADDALEMCQIAWGEGTRMVAATAHQNESWPDVTPERIRDAAAALAAQLAELEVPLEVFPTAEVMVWAGLEEAWDRGELLSVADGGKYLLIELPGGLFLDLASMIVALRERGLIPILAHPERHPELLHAPGVMQRWIELGCLAQVSSGSLTGEIAPRDVKVLRQWAERGHIHLIGSDGHSVRRRPPKLAAAHRVLTEWIGPAAARRICVTNGAAVFRGEPIEPVRPARPAPRRGWLSRFFD